MRERFIVLMILVGLSSERDLRLGVFSIGAGFGGRRRARHEHENTSRCGAREGQSLKGKASNAREQN